MDNVYCYTPLSNINDTRLLVLHPGKSLDNLSCQLNHVDLEHCPPYEALSYQWGNPHKEHRITQENGFYILITKSLYDALRDLRHENLSRTIWADGICINQDDIIERQQQVSMMRLIYSQATQVVTYIGPERDGSSMAIDVANEIMKCHEAARNQRDTVRRSEHRLLSINSMSRSDPSCAALRAFILRGWSGRSWCAQEFLLNRNLTITCGRKTIGWDVIPAIILLSYRHSIPPFFVPNQAEDPLDQRECLIKLSTLRRETFIHGKKLPLAQLLPLLHPFQATDPRDKIYSVFSLCDEAVDIAVDYDCSVQQLYITVATRLLDTSSSLHLLYNNLGKKAHNLPSWVPDWSTWQVGSQGIAWDGPYLACGFTSCKFQVRSIVKLAVVGCLIDQIEEVSEPIGPYYKYVRAPGHGEWLRKQEELVQKTKYQPHGSDVWEALPRTLIASDTWTANKRGPDGDLKLAYLAHRNISNNSSPEEETTAIQFVNAVRRRSRYRRLCLSKRGFFSGVPEEAEVGDWICMIHGMKLLFVIRPAGAEFRYVGHAYVDGLMMGKVLEFDWYKKRAITLI